MRSLKIINAIAAVLASATLFAQQADVEMADTMRSNGKIYVVVGVLSTLFIGISLYLISIDRKISKIEKELRDNKNNK